MHIKFLCITSLGLAIATTFEKIAEKLKTLNPLGIFLSANVAGTPCSFVAMFFVAMYSVQYHVIYVCVCVCMAG